MLSRAQRTVKQLVRMGHKQSFTNTSLKATEKSFLNTLRYCWDNNRVPDLMNGAYIASIFKKGNFAKPQNYGPMALLNLFYKFYTIIVRERIKLLDQFIRSIQFGVRKTVAFNSFFLQLGELWTTSSLLKNA